MSMFQTLTKATGGRVLNRQWDDRRGRFETLAEFVLRAAESPPAVKVALDGEWPGEALWTAVELLSHIVHEFLPRERLVFGEDDYTALRTFTDILNGCLCKPTKQARRTGGICKKRCCGTGQGTNSCSWRC